MVDVAISKIRSMEGDSLQTYVRSESSGMQVIYRHAVRERNSFGLVPLLVQITRSFSTAVVPQLQLRDFTGWRL
jgi:hypothetical protein